MNLIKGIQTNVFWFLINIIGLGVALAGVLAISAFVANELSFDRFHPNADRIYRVTLETNTGTTTMHPARVIGNWVTESKQEIPEIETVVRLVPFRRSVVNIENQKFYATQAYSTDSAFFDVFSINLLSGTKENCLTQPGKVLISRSLSEKYFGNSNTVGQTVSILNQQLSKPLDYTVEGVFEDFPSNSHFQPSLLTSMTKIEGQSNWAYSYYKIAKDADINQVREKIQQRINSTSPDKSITATIHLQKLTNIHLYSNKTREMQENGSLRLLILLISAGIVIMVIALINFVYLYRVKYIRDSKLNFIKSINGATNKNLFVDYLSESLFIAGSSILVALVLANEFSTFLKVSMFTFDFSKILVFILLATILLVCAIATFPFYTASFTVKPDVEKKGVRIYTIPLLLQYSLSIVVIISTIIIGKQILFLNNQHPESDNSNILIMSNNPWEAVQRFETFKSELLKIPQVIAVSGAMEQPGGDILDATPFEMEGIDKEQIKTINIFTADTNFFSLLNITPIAGSSDFGYSPSSEWEKTAMNLSMLAFRNEQNTPAAKELEAKLGNYREKYILNQSALRMLGISDPQEAIGKRFRINFHLPYLFPEGEVIGVVPDFHYTNLRSEERPMAIISKKTFMHCFMIEVENDQLAAAIPEIKKTWEQINPGYPFQYSFMDETYRKVYEKEYSQMDLLLLFAAISLLLSSLGMFAMSSFNMQRRIKEIGIRKVNGARTWEIMLMLNRDFVQWVAVAFVIACPIAYYAMTEWLQNFAYKTELSWWIFALAGVFTLFIAIGTVSWQTFMAARRNPVEALRYE
jgi:putative ABC transport system permease protein